MWNIKAMYLKNKGFTLLEIILFLGLSSMIILPLLSILFFSINSFEKAEQKDDLFLNARYAIDYIKDEIRMGDKIIDSEKISGLNLKYPTNIGFVIMIDEKNGTDRYITYHTKDFKLIRIACTSINEKYPKQVDFGGFNTISEFVDSIDESKFYPKQSMISLDFKFKYKKEKLNLNSDIYIRCPIEY